MGRASEASRGPAGRQRSVSIRDVAAEASVSITTVSRVLNSSGMVSPATARRVHDAIGKLGYRPNFFARGLMTRKSRVIGILLPDIYGEFYSELLRGADAEARRRGYHLLVSSDVQPDGMPSAVMPYGFIDGLAVMVTEPNQKSWDEAIRLHVPVCLLDGESVDGVHDCVIIDNESGTRDASEHLLSTTPARKCFYVGGAPENFDAQERGRVFASSLAAAGHQIETGQISFRDYTTDWGIRWARDMLAKGELRGCAVLAGNDEIAFGVMMAAMEAGLRLPQDLQLVGFDDTRLCSLVRPALSTVRVPLRELGSTAVELVVRRLEDLRAGPERRRLHTSLVVRRTSGRPI